MPVLVTLWDYLGEPKTEDGIWSLVGGAGYEVGPTPPATFDDSIDMEGYGIGTYRYKYYVASALGEGCYDQSYVDIVVGVTKDRTNDDCAGSMTIPYSAITGTGGILNQNNIDNCATGGLSAPTDSGEDEPAAWSAVTSYSGDLWYKWSSANLPTDVQIEVTVTSASYGTDGMQNPMLAIYSATTGCGTLTEEDSSVGSGTSGTVQIDSPAGAAFPIYLRIACPEGDEGKFDIIITTNA